MLDFESKLKIRPDYQSQGDDLKDAQDKDIADQYAQGIENPVIRRPWYTSLPYSILKYHKITYFLILSFFHSCTFSRLKVFSNH